MRISDWSSDVCSSDLTYTKQRLEQFPDVPTAQEQGIDLVVNKFRGIAGPKNLPDEIYAKWEQGIQSVLKDPEFQEWYRAQSLVPEFMAHEEYAKFIDAFAEEQQAFFKQYGIIRSEEHTSELQSLMRTSYAVFCLK